MKKIVIVAGDTSGDLYGGHLARKLKEKFAEIEIYSFGGPRLAKHSNQLLNLLSHSVAGIFEVVSSLKKLLNSLELASREINKIKPDLVILIDFPDFNLRLAEKLNRRFPLFYYVSPQVWAWRKKRIETIKKYVDKMVVIFKFEEDFYKKEDLDVVYFGHPLLEIIGQREAKPKKIVSFMPGSRKNEVRNHLPIMQETKEILEIALPEYRFRIIKPESLPEGIYTRCRGFELIGHSYEAIQESEFIITSSGTATVEIAILEIPFIIIYKVNPLTLAVLKRLVKTEYIGMVNILAQKKIIQEFLQSQAQPKILAEKTLELIRNRASYNNVKDQLRKLKEVLSPYGATSKFADFIGDYLHLRRLAQVQDSQSA